MSLELPPPNDHREATPATNEVLPASEAIRSADLAIPDWAPPQWDAADSWSSSEAARTALDDNPQQPSTPAAIARPHPGFWWSFLWCFLMIMVAQVMPAVAIIVLFIIVKSAQLGDVGLALEWLTGPEGAKAYLKPTLIASQVFLTIFSLFALRLVVGRDWTRQVGLRLPSPSHLLLAMLALPALWLSASGCYALAQATLPGLPQLPAYALTLVGVLLVVSLYWLAVRWTTGRDWTHELQRAHPGGQVVLSLLGIVLAVVVARTLFTALAPRLGALTMFEGQNMMEDLVKDVRNWNVVLAVLTIGLGPGIGEELFCRAFLGRGLVGRHGLVMGVLLTSLFFGFIHGDPHQGTMAALMGVALHYAYLTSRSLLIPMLMHFLNNSLSVVAPHLEKWTGLPIESVDSESSRVPVVLFVGAGLLLAAVAWAMYRGRARLETTDGSGSTPWQPAFPGAAWPPAGSGTAVVVRDPGWLPTLAVLAGVIALALSFVAVMLLPKPH